MSYCKPGLGDPLTPLAIGVESRLVDVVPCTKCKIVVMTDDYSYSNLSPSFIYVTVSSARVGETRTDYCKPYIQIRI
jgi:hypothetical protein